MKSSLLRITLILTVLTVLFASLPACAETAAPGTNPAACSIPWWEISPPVPPRTRTRVVTRTAETMVESIPAEGYCYTAIKKVNVRSQPSIYATRVATIKSAGTEFIVTARAKNSSGEIWYAVELANGTLGYIRSDLLNTDHVILLDDPYEYEEKEPLRSVPASESASDILNIVTDRKVKHPDPTPQVIYVVKDPEPTPAPAAQPTPTPIIVYITPEPEQNPEPEITPQVIYIYQDNDQG